MKTTTWIACLASLACTVTAVRYEDQYRHHRQLELFKKHLGSTASEPTIPSYNFTMPIDHFNKSDTRTYNNRYWVNDTYYEPGGPVILYDFGEAGVSDGSARHSLAEYNGSISAPMQLARRVNGLVIGWEHRYYGLSLPFPTNKTRDPPASELFWINYPEGAPESFKYLTIEQSLEDVNYFANNFGFPAGNATGDLPDLRASQVPWIWVGGSYPGMRGTWIRERNPETFYAVWASSAPVETVYDGGVYYNPIYRALPSNCTADVHAVVQHVDKILGGDDQNAILRLRQMVAITQGTTSLNVSDYAVDPGYLPELSTYQIVQPFVFPFWSEYQSLGAGNTTQKFCNYMEAFNVEAFTSNASSTDSNITTVVLTIFYNPDDTAPTTSGIVATHDAEAGLAAYLYGMRRFNAEFHNRLNEDTAYTVPDFVADIHAWRWQVVTEVGLIQANQPNSSINMISSYFNMSAIRKDTIESNFGLFDPDIFPPRPNVSAGLKYGGWDMTPSNVMWTNGEFDPWRSMGVASQEYNVGAPNRTLTQVVPACNVPPNGSDVFGLLYAGAVHCADLAVRNSIAYNGAPPLEIGLDLFVRALDVWLPCFNETKAERARSTTSSAANSGTTSSAHVCSSGSCFAALFSSWSGTLRRVLWTML